MSALSRVRRPSVPHRWRTPLGLAGAVVLLGLAGCSGTGSAGGEPSAGTTTAASAPAASTSAASTPQATSASPSPTSTPSATAQAAATCTTSNLTVRYADDKGGGAAGSVYGTLTFTNTSGSTCALRGYPGVSYVGYGKGTQIGAAATRSDGQVKVVTLASGKKAKATLQRVNAGNYSGACGSHQVDGLRIYPPGQQAAAFVKLKTTGCTKKSAQLLAVGPVR